MEEQTPDYVPYHAYLIRMWPARREGVVDCRVFAQNISTGERETFTGLQSLLVFLEAQITDWENPRGGRNASDETPDSVGNRGE